MSAGFYRYIYNRQSYNRFRETALASRCSNARDFKFIMDQIEAWREWEREYRENMENGLPAPPMPEPIDTSPPSPTQEEIDDCKRAYANVHKKTLMNPNSNMMSTNRRIGYWVKHQTRVPKITEYKMPEHKRCKKI